LPRTGNGWRPAAEKTEISRREKERVVRDEKAFAVVLDKG
jgi:hypothetical protein